MNDMQSYVDCLNPNGTLLLVVSTRRYPFIDACIEKGLTYVKNWKETIGYL
jgi:ribosomal protein L11 methyltransferase